MKKFRRLIIMLLMLVSGLPLLAASREITGIVTDNSGEPLVGASIMLQNSRIGCMADLDGKFSLQIPEGKATLKVTLIGYKTDIINIAANQNVVNIKLQEDSQMLEETVVVGYGTQKKVNLTGAVAAIEGKSLEGRPVNDVSTMLQGAVAGLNVTTTSGKPGSTAELNIRGTTSINSAGPLILIDGAVGDLDSVDPNDVAQISVIKDASAAAIYGARAAFGVILVTTKRGDENDGKATVRYNGRFGWTSPTTPTDYEHRGYYHIRVLEDFSQQSSQTPFFSSMYWGENDWAELLYRINDKTEHPERPWAVEAEVNGKKIWKYYANTDWWHEMFNDNRFSTQHNISLSGGNKAVRYFISGGLKHDDGILKLNTDKFNSYNIRSKIDFTINKWATFENNTTLYGSKYTYQGDNKIENTLGFSNMYGLSTYPTHNPDGSYIYETTYSSCKPTSGRYIVMSQGLHPGAQVKTDIMTMSRLNITPFRQLTITGDFTYRFLQNRNMTRSNKIPYRVAPDDEMSYYTTGMGNDDLKETVNTRQYYSVNALATYKDVFADKHNLNIVAGYNWESYNDKQIKTYVMNLGNPELSDVGLAPSLEGASVVGGQNEYAIMGVFGRINYDYMGKYLIELSGRYDGTSRFAKGHQWGWFPSGSIGWRFSEEKFFEHLQPVWSNGKIRFSYGSLGNQNVSSYYTFLRQVTLTTSSDYIFKDSEYVKRATADAPVASDMTWEKSNQWDLGLDLGFFNNRLNAVVDLYIRDTKDMLTAGMALPSTYGAAVPEMNAADLRTRGYELSLEWNDSFNLWNNKFSYNIGFNISDYRSKITKFDNPTKLLSNYYVGQEFGEIWGYRIGGLFQTDEEAQEYAERVDLSKVNKGIINGWQAGDLMFVDINEDGKITEGQNTLDNHGDLVKLGNSLASLQYGFRLGFSYYGFDLAALFQGTGNHYYYPASSLGQFWGCFADNYQVSFLPDYFKDSYWSEKNPDAYFPRPYISGAKGGALRFANDRYLQNLRYLRFKNLTIGYTFPRKWMRKIAMDKLRLYFTAENLCYWSPTKEHMKYIDPEAAFERLDNSKFNMAFYPWPKTIMFGIDIQF